MREDYLKTGPGVTGARINADGTIGLRPGYESAGSRGYFAGWLKRIGRLIACEHACDPPVGYERRIASHLARYDGSTYCCPECGQVFAGHQAVVALKVSLSTPVCQPVPATILPFPERGREGHGAGKSV